MRRNGAIKQILIITAAAVLTLLIMKWVIEHDFNKTIDEVKDGIANVTEGIDGFKDKIDEAKDGIAGITEKFNDAADKITETKEKVETKIDQIETAANEISEAYDAVKEVTD